MKSTLKNCIRLAEVTIQLIVIKIFSKKLQRVKQTIFCYEQKKIAVALKVCHIQCIMLNWIAINSFNVKQFMKLTTSLKVFAKTRLIQNKYLLAALK